MSVVSKWKEGGRLLQQWSPYTKAGIRAVAFSPRPFVAYTLALHMALWFESATKDCMAVGIPSPD